MANAKSQRCDEYIVYLEAVHDGALKAIAFAQPSKAGDAYIPGCCSMSLADIIVIMQNHRSVMPQSAREAWAQT